MMVKDTLTSTTNVGVRAVATAALSGAGISPNESTVASTGVTVADSSNATTAAYTAASFLVFLESGTGQVIASGTYTFTAIVNAYDAGVLNAAKTVTKDFSIVVATPAADSLVANAANSTAILSEGATWVTGTLSDSTVALASTASTDVEAVVRVLEKCFRCNFCKGVSNCNNFSRNYR